MTDYTGIHQGLPNDEYRQAQGDSATLLKGCLRSVKHALIEKKPTKALNSGLRLHSFILEREDFLKSYGCGLNPDDYPDAIHTAEDLRAAAKAFNETRNPSLKVSGSRDTLLEQIAADDTEHLSNVQDVSALSATDLRNLIKNINAQPNRGTVALSGSSAELYDRLIKAGWSGEYYPVIEADHANNQPEGVTVLPRDEYMQYESMYQSLIQHLTEGAEFEREAGEGAIMQWLLHAFTTPGVMETEVSMLGANDKCRMDMMFQAGEHWFACDLKRTVDASDEGFNKQAARYHYDLQAAHYSAVSAEVERPIITFAFIAIEPEEPWAVNVMIPDEEFMRLGQKKRAYAKKQLSDYRERGTMTAYLPKAKALTPPAWASYGPWEDED